MSLETFDLIFVDFTLIGTYTYRSLRPHDVFVPRSRRILEKPGSLDRGSSGGSGHVIF